MSRAFYNHHGSCYIQSVDRGPLAAFFERKYLEWQLKNGRASVEEFARLLGIQQPALSALMSGRRKGMRRQTALQIAEKLDDYEIMDILGYARPEPELSLDVLPSGFRGRLTAAMSEINQTLLSRNIDADTPEGVAIAKEVLGRFGFNVTEIPE